jgi:hypothetical protein
MFPSVQQGEAKLAEGLHFNLPHEHRHQHTYFQKTQSSVRSISTIGTKKLRKKQQQQKRKN